jgi:hypothetical protein
MEKIVVNGKTYGSVDEMPPDIRKIYESTMGLLSDKNQNGIPDIFENNSENNINIQNISVQPGKAIIIGTDGKVYNNISELSPEAQEKYTHAMEKLGQVLADKNQNGIPDLMENIQAHTNDISVSKIYPMIKNDLSASSQFIGSPLPKEQPSYRWLYLVIIALVLLFGIIILGIVIYFYLLQNNYARLHL